jgi:hypothetical protein
MKRKLLIIGGAVLIVLIGMFILFIPLSQILYSDISGFSVIISGMLSIIS